MPLLQKTLSVFILICVSTFTAPCRAQSDASGRPTIFKYVEVMPSFNGKLSEFMSGNLVYPKSSIAHNDTGRVIIEFTVQTTGMVQNAYVLRSSGHDSLDAEALRVVKIWERERHWNPGKQKGKEVPVFFTIPVSFKLD